MTTFLDRKKKRIESHIPDTVQCTACSGSGWYDYNQGVPQHCGCCNGTGRMPIASRSYRTGDT